MKELATPGYRRLCGTESKVHESEVCIPRILSILHHLEQVYPRLALNGSMYSGGTVFKISFSWQIGLRCDLEDRAESGISAFRGSTVQIACRIQNQVAIGPLAVGSGKAV